MDILVLEDDSSRQIAFLRWGYVGNTVTVVATVESAVRNLQGAKFDVLFIDHDLGGRVYVNSFGEEPTGYDLALWLVENRDLQPKTIITHSLNEAGRKNIISVLPEALAYPFAWVDNLGTIFTNLGI